MIKFQLVYPQLIKHLPLPKLGKLSWKQELKKRLKIKKIVRQEIDEMADKYFSKTELSKSDFHMFDDILVQHHHDRSNVHLYITDELSLILKSGTDDEELTAKYYSGKCIQHVKHAIMRPQVSSWPAMEDEGCLSYEAVLVQVALWCQPSLLDCTAAVARALDSLAARVLGHLATSRPKHPIFRGQDTDSADTDWAQLIGLLPPVASSPGDTMWSAQDTRDILASTNHILYEVEGFTGNKEDYYNPNNSYINVILETKQVSESLKTITMTMMLCPGYPDNTEPAVHLHPGQAGGGLPPHQLPRTLHAQVAGAPGRGRGQEEVHFH